MSHISGSRQKGCAGGRREATETVSMAHRVGSGFLHREVGKGKNVSMAHRVGSGFL